MANYSDFLLTFRKGTENYEKYRQVSAGESILIETGEGCLRAQTGGERQFPCEQFQNAEWDLFLAGALYPYLQTVAEQKKRFLSNPNANILNGNFFVVAWNKLTHEWHIWTDRLGTLHLYHAGNEHRAALGTSFRAVASIASRRKLDWLGLTAFFQFGFFPENRTFYEDVHLLQPASHSVLSEHGQLLCQERYWEWEHECVPQRTYGEALEEFTFTFDHVMEDMTTRGRIAVPISGGLDSRSTVAALFHPEQETSRFWCYSYGYSANSVETHIAAEIAGARQLPFEAFTIRPYLFEHLQSIVAAVEGFQDVTQCRQAFVRSELRNHADSVITAHWGDVWLDGMGLHTDKPLSGELFLDTAWKKFSKRGGSELVDILCGPHISGDDPQRLLKQALGEKTASLEHIQDADFRLKALKAEWWSFRWTLVSIRLFQAAAWPCLPFYDNRLVDFFCRTPSSFVQGRQMQIDYIKKKAPDLARITWQAYDSNLYRYNQPDLLRLPRRAIRKARQIVTKQEVLQRNWEVQFLNPEGKAGLEQWLLRPGLRIHEFVAPIWLWDVVVKLFQKPDAILGYQTSILLSFSAWLETYG